ncbi:MAG: hypothetical protein N3A66_00225 [Planctomycetota bacterium]|nr:hypothetical protein [Planctomycetota bacterium]
MRRLFGFLTLVLIGGAAYAGDGAAPLPPKAAGAGALDLRLDVTNDGEIDERDEAVEDDAQKPGKVFSVNHEDHDGDGIPDFADGFDLDGKADTVRLTVIVLEFVVPDATYHEKENYDAKPVPVKFIGASEPKPWLKLCAPAADDVKIAEADGKVIVTVRCEEVRDPIADNIPMGKGADIASVSISVDGEVKHEAVPVKRLPYNKAGKKGFWRSFPYKGVFAPVEVEIPLAEGLRVIHVETAKNAAENIAFAELMVDIERDEDGKWVANAKFGNASERGFYCPCTQRVRGFASPEVAKEFKISFGEVDMPLEEHDGAYYISNGIDDEEEYRLHGD